MPGVKQQEIRMRALDRLACYDMVSSNGTDYLNRPSAQRIILLITMKLKIIQRQCPPPFFDVVAGGIDKDTSDLAPVTESPTNSARLFQRNETGTSGKEIEPDNIGSQADGQLSVLYTRNPADFNAHCHPVST